MQQKTSPSRSLLAVERLTIQQVAKWARVSTKSIYRWIESREVPVVKFAERTYRIPTTAMITQLRASGYDHLADDNYKDWLICGVYSYLRNALVEKDSLCASMKQSVLCFQLFAALLFLAF